jgi:hypothetical protein
VAELGNEPDLPSADILLLGPVRIVNTGVWDTAEKYPVPAFRWEMAARN